MGHVDNDFRFTGEQMDDKTGLIYLRARYYDPNVGRFISKDPFAGFTSDVQSLNRYAYVGNNPVNYIDSTGLWELGFSPACLFGICTVIESPIDAGFTETGTFVSFNLGLHGDIKKLANIKKIVGSVGEFVSISSGTPETGYSCDIYAGSFSTDCNNLHGSPPDLSDLELSTNLDAGIKGSATIVFRYPWDVPWEDIGVLGRAAKRQLTPPWEDIGVLGRATKRQLTPPWEDIGVLGRATWRWMIPEAHSSELVMGK